MPASNPTLDTLSPARDRLDNPTRTRARVKTAPKVDRGRKLNVGSKNIPVEPTRRAKVTAFFGYRFWAVAILFIILWQGFHVVILDALIAGYLAAALLYRIESRISFGLGLVLFGMVPAFLILGQTTRFNNYAVYAYYMFAIGAMSAIMETRREPTRGL